MLIYIYNLQSALGFKYMPAILASSQWGNCTLIQFCQFFGLQCSALFVAFVFLMEPLSSGPAGSLPLLNTFRPTCHFPQYPPLCDLYGPKGQYEGFLSSWRITVPKISLQSISMQPYLSAHLNSTVALVIFLWHDKLEPKISKSNLHLNVQSTIMITNPLWKSSIAKIISSSRGCRHLRCRTLSPPSVWALISDHVSLCSLELSDII